MQHIILSLQVQLDLNAQLSHQKK